MFTWRRNHSFIPKYVSLLSTSLPSSAALKTFSIAYRNMRYPKLLFSTAHDIEVNFGVAMNSLSSAQVPVPMNSAREKQNRQCFLSYLLICRSSKTFRVRALVRKKLFLSSIAFHSGIDFKSFSFRIISREENSISASHSLHGCVQCTWNKKRNFILKNCHCRNFLPTILH